MLNEFCRKVQENFLFWNLLFIMGDKNEQKDPKTEKPSPKSSSSFGVFSSLGVIVVAVAVYFVFGIQRKQEIAPELRGDSISPRIRNDLLNELEKNR